MNLTDFSEGMTAKIEGTVCLDELTKDEPLDFFVYFLLFLRSSVILDRLTMRWAIIFKINI